MKQHVFEIDVSEAAALGEAAHVAVTVHLPQSECISDPPIVCFGKPGGGYSRGYYTCDLPGPSQGIGSEADWHAERGWIFVSVDHLGVGGSSLHDAALLDYAAVSAANSAAEAEVLKRLCDGTLDCDFPPVCEPVTIGIGQSMGGCLTVVQQGRFSSYDGIGVLGYSAVHTHPPVRPGMRQLVAPWYTRDRLIGDPSIVTNRQAIKEFMSNGPYPDRGQAMAWGFHYDDVPDEVVESDLAHFNRDIHDPASQAGHTTNPWNSLTTPGAVAQTCLTPGIIAAEAAAVSVPVLVGMGERDTCADVKGEARAYLSATSVDIFVCPRMGHMHNFAGTRELFWQRIDRFGNWCAEMKKHRQIAN